VDIPIKDPPKKLQARRSFLYFVGRGSASTIGTEIVACASDGFSGVRATDTAAIRCFAQGVVNSATGLGGASTVDAHSLVDMSVDLLSRACIGC